MFQDEIFAEDLQSAQDRSRRHKNKKNKKGKKSGSGDSGRAKPQPRNKSGLLISFVLTISQQSAVLLYYNLRDGILSCSIKGRVCFVEQQQKKDLAKLGEKPRDRESRYSSARHKMQVNKADMTRSRPTPTIIILIFQEALRQELAKVYYEELLQQNQVDYYDYDYAYDDRDPEYYYYYYYEE